MVVSARHPHHARMHPTRVVFALVFAIGAAAPPALLAVCGDNHIDGSEECDGTDVGGKTCADLTAGFVQSGTVACKPDCTFDTSDCRRAFIESLAPANGGQPKNRCQLEWGAVGTALDPRNRTKRICSEGDPTCDQDQKFDNTCTIRIQLCLNVPDARVGGCAPAKVVRVDVLQPGLGTEIGQQVASGVLAAAKGAAFDQAHINSNAVSYAPPVTQFACGSSTVRIPVRGTTGNARPGKMRIRARSTDNSGRSRAVGTVTLICNP